MKPQSARCYSVFNLVLYTNQLNTQRTGVCVFFVFFVRDKNHANALVPVHRIDLRLAASPLP